MKLADYKNNSGVFSRGTVFRCPSTRAENGSVDVMVVENLDSEFCLGLMYTTGYDAGYPLAHFKKEACYPGTGMLSVNWLQENWSKYIDSNKPFESVEVLGRYKIYSDFEDE